MPQELHDPPTLRIALPSLHDPCPKALIVAPRPLQHPFPTHRKLRAACRAHLLRNEPLIISVRELRDRGVAENVMPYLWGDVLVVSMRRETAGVPIAAEIHVATVLHEWYLKGIHGVDVGMQRGICVPGAKEAGSVGMQEGEGGREGGVVVDYVGQVGHALVAFVEGCCEGVGVRGVGGGVDGVDCALPAGRRVT